MSDQSLGAVTPRMADALRDLMGAAVRVASYAVAATDLPKPHVADLMRAVDEGRAYLSLQITVPNGDVAVMADGPGWVKPTSLLIVSPNGAVRDPPPPPAAA